MHLVGERWRGLEEAVWVMNSKEDVGKTAAFLTATCLKI
jgi:hypothetical protein